MDKKFIIRLVNLYTKRSHLDEIEYSTEHIKNDLNNVKKEIKMNEKKILSILPKIKEIMNKPKDFINSLKELIQKDAKKFSISFAEPYLDDFINILLFDVKRKRVVNEKTLDKWKEAFSKEGIKIDF